MKFFYLPIRISRRNSSHLFAGLAVALAVTFTNAHAQSESPIQSKARPFDLDIAAPVMAAGSDARSERFQGTDLPAITAYLQSALSEQKGLDSTAYLLDPDKLLLRTESNLRVYFLGEGANHQNTLGFNVGNGSESVLTPVPPTPTILAESNNGKGKDKKADKDKGKTADPVGEIAIGVGSPSAPGPGAQLIFPDASSPVRAYDPASEAVRSQASPLLPGDFVNLGRFDAGTRLDFFLIANGAAGGTTTYSTQSSLNPDSIGHVVAYAYGLKDSPYLILGFEDLYGGGDQDFNDLLFALDIGRVNLAALTATPEPATVLVMGACVALGILIKRRADARATPHPAHS